MSSPAPESSRFVIVPHRPYARGLLITAGVLWAASLVAVWFWASARAAPELERVQGELAGQGAQMRQQDKLLSELRQQVTTLRRSDQISRSANTELQATLAEREEEISGLRADVAFYERLVGATGQRRGLTVHEARFAPEAGGTWHYTVTLTQNLNRGAISRGELRLSVEGVSAGRLRSLRWDELLQKDSAPGQPYSFRYFQQLEGSVMLPAGFTPQRVRVQLRGDGQNVEQTLPWQAPETTQE
jgi:hypothetical protein